MKAKHKDFITATVLVAFLIVVFSISCHYKGEEPLELRPDMQSVPVVEHDVDSIQDMRLDNLEFFMDSLLPLAHPQTIRCH